MSNTLRKQAMSKRHTATRACVSSLAVAKTLYFPHYGDGGGLSMILVVNNLSDRTATGFLSVFDAEGRPKLFPSNRASHPRLICSYPSLARCFCQRRELRNRSSPASSLLSSTRKR